MYPSEIKQLYLNMHRMQIKVALTLIYAKSLGLVANCNKQNAKPSQDVRLNLCAHRVC